MKRSAFAKKTSKIAFFGLAGLVGILLTVSAVKKKGENISKTGKKFFGNAKRSIKSVGDTQLNSRQKEILKLFVKHDKVSNELISDTILSVSSRTLRRDLDELEAKKYIRQVGKTRGSYYVAE